MAAMVAQDLKLRFEEEIKGIRSEEDVLRIKAAFLGKKGHLSTLLRSLGELPSEERPRLGAETNRLKEEIENRCRQIQTDLSLQKRQEKVRKESVDVTLPGRGLPRGGRHPLSQVLEEVQEIFRGIGFSLFEGPELETDYYNFEALNIPKDHPARDMQDTFYIDVGAGLPRPEMAFDKGAGTAPLLRTHTSPVQIHVMEKMKPPIRMIAPGAVYRRDSDVSHTPMFHQVEGLVVGEGIRFSDLKGTISHFLERFFGGKKKIRFRPSFFPFTEPSAEVDMQWGDKWLEVMGCGMVHPSVFEKVGYDTKKNTGFAFGMGIERLAMIRFGIPDIRLFFENDLRFLKQF